MIKNERQYRITRNQAARFSQTLESLRQRTHGAEDGMHPLIAKAQEDAVRSQLEDLQNQVREYEALKAGEFAPDELHLVAALPAALIKARIALGLSQRDLAKRLNMKEQQIQRYEATDYATASLSRIGEVVRALGIDIGAGVQR